MLNSSRKLSTSKYWILRLCLLERSGLRDIRVRNYDNVNVRGLNHRLTICWHTDVTDSQPLAVCDDCLCLISLIQTMMYLSYDGDGALEWIGHDEGYDCSPAIAIFVLTVGYG